MIINHNISALNTYRNLTSVNNALQKSLERLSSGLRINRAADDAAGLAISEKMRGQIRGLNQAVRNAQDGISLIQTAEGALNEVHSILQRMRELAVQAANETTTAEDRNAIQDEIKQLKAEIDRIAQTTEFNTKKLLNGEIGTSTSLVGTDAAKVGNEIYVTNYDVIKSDTYKVTATLGSLSAEIVSANNGVTSASFSLGSTASVAGLALGNYTLVIEGTDMSNANVYLKDEDGVVVASALGTSISGASGEVTLTGTGGIKFTLKKSDNYSAGEARFVLKGTWANAQQITIKGNDGNGATIFTNASGFTIDTPYYDFNGIKFKVTTDFVLGGNNVSTSIKVINNAATFQIGANQGQSMTVGVEKMDTNVLGVADVNLTSLDGAQTAIAKLNAAIARVSTERAKLGAYQNRLEHTINNLSVAKENLTAAESRIRDLDMAEEMMTFTKNQIISQAATAMLAQANQVPAIVLQLLR